MREIRVRKRAQLGIMCCMYETAALKTTENKDFKLICAEWAKLDSDNIPLRVCQNTRENAQMVQNR